MANKDNRWIYWDACVFLSYLEGHPQRLPILEGVWKEVDDNAGKIVSSVLSLTEVAYVNPVDTKAEDEIDALWNDPLIEIVEFNPVIARLARSMIRSSKQRGERLEPADAIHLATAQWINDSYRRTIVEFQTYDPDLKRAPSSIPICEPHVNQYRMDFSNQEERDV